MLSQYRRHSCFVRFQARPLSDEIASLLVVLFVRFLIVILLALCRFLDHSLYSSGCHSFEIHHILISYFLML
jgi:hypothetical protein